MSVILSIFALELESKQEILQYLIRHCFFASNQGRLASLLGQRGRMNIARIMDNNLGERATNNLWDEISVSFSIPEDILPFLPEILELSDLLKQQDNPLPIDVSPNEQYLTGIDEGTRQRIIVLYQENALLYYMLEAIIFAKQLKINPYQQRLMKSSELVIICIDKHLHKAFPQQINAHDAAQELIRTLQNLDVDSWWWIGFFGGSIIRLYHEPSYINTLFEFYLYSMPYPDWQWWREAKSQNAIDTLWYWQKNGGTAAIYEVLRIEDGQNTEEALHFQIVFVGNNILRIVQYDEESTRSMYVGWQMNKIGDIYSLQFSSVNSDEWQVYFPPELVMLDSRTDNRELVGRALRMTKPMQFEINLRIWREIGMEPTKNYKIVDVECSRRMVKILYLNYDDDKIYSSCFSLADFPALRTITAHSEVELLRGINDDKPYAFWNNLGVLIPLVS